MPTDGLGPHRIWYVGGRYAYASIHFAEFTDHVLAIVDMADPRKPQIVGMVAARHVDAAAARRRPGREGRRYALHHALVAGNLAYAPGATAGSPCSTSAIRRSRSSCAIATGTRRSAAARIRRCRCPDRNLLVVADEANFANCSQGLRYIWMFDVREPSNPVSIATLPHPRRGRLLREGRQLRPAQPAREPARRVPELAPDLRHLHNAGVRAYDIDNPFQPREVGYFVPPNPAKMMDPRPNRPQVIQSCDCFVDPQG